MRAVSDLRPSESTMVTEYQDIMKIIGDRGRWQYR